MRTKLEVFTTDYFQKELGNPHRTIKESFEIANQKFCNHCQFYAYSDYRSYQVTLKKSKTKKENV
ncbi:hypothetical protein [Ekhidna sp.]|uniref:hypothetical protein n=1 Tax=Ekhidna sp. TaxID=2608089 RepID=UPI003C7AD005